MKWTTIWIDDWMVGTNPLTPEQRGVYFTIICYFISKDCDIPDNDHYISRLCNMTLHAYRKCRNVLIENDFMLVLDGKIFIEKSAKQWKKDEVFSKLQAKKARKKHEIYEANLLKSNGHDPAPAHAPALPPDTLIPKVSKKETTKVVPKEKTKRGFKLPEDWKPSENDIKYAHDANWSDAEIEKEALNFVERYTNGKGRNETRPEWSKSWKTWVRNNYGNNGMNTTNGHEPSGLTDEQTIAAFGEKAVLR